MNAQTWAVLAGVADRERLAYVLEAVDSMEQDFGFPLNLPPYPEYDAHVGRMSGMLCRDFLRTVECTVMLLALRSSWTAVQAEGKGTENAEKDYA